MRCHRFRVFVTILAAFGPFMAYICRLNLSLIIEDMVVKAPSTEDDKRPPTSAGRWQELTREHAELADRLPKIFREDQSLAELSSSSWWLRKRAGLSEEKSFLISKLNQTRRLTAAAAAARLPIRDDSFNAQLLSISFDANPNVAQNARSESTSKGPGKASGTTSNESAPQQQQQQQQQQRQVSNGVGQTASGELQVAAPDAAGSSGGDDAGQLLNWSKENRNDLLGAFFLGYVIFQVPAGRAAELLGPKLLFLVLGLGTGLSSLVFPYASRWSSGGSGDNGGSNSIWCAYAVRFVMGASQAGLFPAVYVLLCRWLPKSERSSWLAVPSAMGRIGTIVMNFAVPAIMLSANWEWVFYASGLVTLAWAVLFVVFGSDSPATSAWISREERHFIETRMEPPAHKLATATTTLGSSQFSLDAATVGSTVTLDRDSAHKAHKAPAINWLKMLRSRALLILTLVMFTSEWSNMLLLVKLPGFLGPALKMDLDEVGLWSSILVAIYCVQYPLAGVLASRLEAADLEFFNSLRVRKLFELIAHITQAASCLVIALFNDKTVVLASLVVMMLGRSTVGGGQCLMPPELSRDYPGSVMALANSFANIAGVVGPLIVTYLVDEPTQYDSWRNLWLLSAGIFLFGGAMFCLLADNSPQNYCKKPKLGKAGAGGGPDEKPTSRAQLVLPPYVPPPQMSAGASNGDQQQQQQQQQRSTRKRVQVEEPEIVRMDAFARVSSEPKQK